jgi:vesicle-fusing ATPase
VCIQVAENERTPLLSVILEGPSGSGKSAISAKCALETDFPFKKRITPETMVSMSDTGKAAAIHKVFEDAYKSPLSMIILDDLERLLGARASLLHCLSVSRHPCVVQTMFR